MNRLLTVGDALAKRGGSYWQRRWFAARRVTSLNLGLYRSNHDAVRLVRRLL